MRRTYKYLTITTLAGMMATTLAVPAAYGQSLADRIAHVAQQRARAASEDQSQARMLGSLLYTDVTVQFNETPAREAINYLRNALSLNIVGRYNDDRSGTGIDPETPITLDVSGKAALTVLEMILDQCSDDLEQCTWQLRNGFVEIGTKDRLGASKEIRYYPIRDLLFTPPRFDNAPQLDLDSALNQGVGGGGGGGGAGGGGGGFGGGGGSGGGRGGGGGGGSGGGGGGGLFSEPEEDPEMPTEIEQAQEIIELITEIVEPEGWFDNGGEWGSIRYYQGTLIIRAPDFMQRQIGGYPFAIRPSVSAQRVVTTNERRYVTFSGSFSQVEIVGIDSTPVGGAVGNP